MTPARVAERVALVLLVLAHAGAVVLYPLLVVLGWGIGDDQEPYAAFVVLRDLMTTVMFNYPGLAIALILYVVLCRVRGTPGSARGAAVAGAIGVAVLNLATYAAAMSPFVRSQGFLFPILFVVLGQSSIAIAVIALVRGVIMWRRVRSADAFWPAFVRWRA
jgi:hypothetical protein